MITTVHPEGTHYELTLFVSGASGLSGRAIALVKSLCDAHLGDDYALSIVDVHEDPDLALRHGVVATPSLVRESPLPTRRLVGDLSDTHRVLLALGLPSAPAPVPVD